MKSIVIYFSRADENYAVGHIDKGNTEVIAEYISELTNAKMFKIETKKSYPIEYNECIRVAKEEHMNGIQPDLITYLDNVKDYDLIYLGYPIWWETFPMAVKSLLLKLDLEGKIIKPFATHEGSGLGHSELDLHTLCPRATIMPGLAIQGSKVYSAKEIVEKWL